MKKQTIFSVAVKFISLTAAVSLMMSAITGCTKKETQSEGGETEVLTYWCSLGGSAATVLSSFNEMEMYQEAQKKTGVEIKFRHPPTGQEAEQFNLMVASRDMPDLVEYSWQSYPGGPDKAIGDGIILKLNDYINEYAPNFKKLVEENKSIEKQVKTDDNSLYAFPAIGIDTITISTGPMVRKDWLDDLNLEMPETIGEWEVMLTAFKEQKGAAAPLSGTADTLLNNEFLNGAFNIGSRYYIDNGKVKYGPIQPEYKEYIATLRRWYENGLIDPDIFSNNSKAVETSVTSGNTGAVYGGIGAVMGTYANAMKSRDDKFKLSAVQFPVMNKGDSPNFMPRAWEVRASGMLAITSVNKSPEKSTIFADLFYSEEGNLLKNFGVEGKTYVLENNYPKYTDEILNNTDGLSISQALSKYTRASTPSPGLIDPRYHEQYYQLEEQQDAMKLWNKIADRALSVTLPQVTFTNEESEKISNIHSNIDAYLEEQTTKIIMGLLPIEDLDTMQANLEKMKIGEALEIYQSAYERYQSR